jgi:hypothetical protein
MRQSNSRNSSDNDRLSYQRSMRLFRFTLRWVMAPMLTLMFLASIVLVVAAAIQGPVYAITAMSVSAAFLLMLWVAFSSAEEKADENVFPEPILRTPWRLVDPHLSHWGVWRAELGRLPDEIAECKNKRQVDVFIHKLLQDWSTNRRHPMWDRWIDV